MENQLRTCFLKIWNTNRRQHGFNHEIVRCSELWFRFFLSDIPLSSWKTKKKNEELSQLQSRNRLRELFSLRFRNLDLPEPIIKFVEFSFNGYYIWPKRRRAIRIKWLTVVDSRFGTKQKLKKKTYFSVYYSENFLQFYLISDTSNFFKVNMPTIKNK